MRGIIKFRIKKPKLAVFVVVSTAVVLLWRNIFSFLKRRFRLALLLTENNKQVREIVKRIRHLFRRFALKAAVLSALIGLIFTLTIPHIKAESSAWDFGVSGDYTFDSNLIEVISNSGRLKDQQYVTDANTAGLWHNDESSGLTADDASANANDATLCANGSVFSTGKINNALSLDGNASCAKVNDSASLSMSSALTQEAFVKFNSAFDKTSGNPFTVTDKGNYKLYFDSTDGKLKFELDPSTAKSWTKQGEGVGNSWPIQNPGSVRSLVEYSSALYVGLEGAAGDAEIWRYSGSGTSWTKIGGDGLNSSWGDQMFESVTSLIVRGTNILAGLGSTTNDAEVWSWNGSAWTKIGGDGLNQSWSSNDRVFAFANIGSITYAATGSNGAGGANVYSYDGSIWTWIGGQGINSSWAATTYEQAYSITASATTLYVGLGFNTGEAEVWSWNGSSWTKIADDGLGFSAGYEIVASLVYSGTTLYAGLSNNAGDADVYSWNGTTWTQIGGDALNSSWTGSYESVQGLIMVNSVLYAGLGTNADDAEVWSWNGSAWTKIGGDTLNSSWTYGKESAWLGSLGNDLIVGTGIEYYDSEVWRYSGGAWSWIGGKD
ncbi:MAG: putative secreted protein containing fibronectin type III protein, partial [Candidatus Berkelbacteria bacterium Athens1014_28]